MVNLTKCPTPEKMKHNTEEGARLNLKHQKLHSKENKKRLALLAVYLCTCGAWHIGHNKFKTARSTRMMVGR